MTRTLGAMLDERALSLRGRDRERAALRELLEPDGPLVAVVHGIAGVGKSALVRAFAADARGRGARVVALDGRVIEPSKRGVLAALAGETGAEAPDAAAAAKALGALAEQVVLVLDEYDRLGLVDAWVCRTFAPVLPANVRLVLAGREAPTVGWLRDYGPLVRVVPVDVLAPADAEAVLVAAGASPTDAAWLNQRARGHALSLQLMAASLPARGAATESDDVAAVAVDELARTYLDGLDPATREALDAASVVRRTTLALLGAMLPQRPAEESLARLRALPFVELSRDGYLVHDTVRETVAALLRAGDPARLRAYRAAAWRVARADLRDATSRDAFRAIADVLYLVDDPLVRDFFFTASQNDHAVQPAGPDDWPAIRALAERWQEDGATARLEAWWRLAPAAFAVARDGQGEVSAFRCVTDARAVTAELAGLDPLVGRWRDHERRNPVGRGDVVVYERFLCAREDGELAPGHRVPSAGRAALLLDLKRLAVELRPNLRRVYASQPIVESAYGLCSLALGYVAMPGERPGADGIPYASMMLELGPGSVDEWLAGVASRLLMVDEQGPIDAAARELVLDGQRTPLTPLELGVLRVLCEREGRVVSRAELRRQVWGHDWDGGANVVDVVVSALRRKLGTRAGALETVRGVGYRVGSLR